MSDDKTIESLLVESESSKAINDSEKLEQIEQSTNDLKSTTNSRSLLTNWLNRNMKVKITDGRIIIGIFLCTDKHSNIILGSCQEYIDSPENAAAKESRTIGLSMIPGNHILSIHIDEPLVS